MVTALASNRSGQRRHRALMAGLLFVVLAAGGLVVADLDAEQRRAADDRVVLAQTGSVQSALQSELYRSVNLGQGLRSILVANPAIASEPDRIEVMLADAYAQGVHVRSIGIAPDDVIRFVYPRAGNEAALGVAYRAVPEQWADVLRARVSGRTVLAGPLDLLQGGTAMVSRTPVFLTDGTYWGVVTLVLDLDSLLAEVADITSDTDIQWAVRSLAQGGEPGVVVTGDPDLFERGATRQFEVPDGVWEVAAISARASGVDVRGLVTRLLTLVVSAALAWAAYRVSRIRDDVVALSRHDPLTGLPNRRLLYDRFDQAMALADRADRPLHVLYLDLDDFKPVNEVHGHQGGDRVLAELGRRLAARVRASDTVARIGGDEFVVLAPDTDTPGVRQLAIDLQEMLAEPIAVDDHQIVVGASVGIARFPEDGTSMDELLHAADARMYQAKRERRAGATAADGEWVSY
jgi:diguanylate cyclase